MGRECKEKRAQLESVKVKNKWRRALKIPEQTEPAQSHKESSSQLIL